MMNIIKSPIEKFTHIFHIADVHIRLNKRHDEYREVFLRMYDEIKKTPDTTVVAILGDVCHNKSDLSPECVQMVSELFSKIADIRPLVLIAGNHDATLANKNRLDCLTPIVNALNHPNLFYLNSTGLYGMGNILWNNMCIFDSPDKYILGKDIPSTYRNQYDHIIALFHGAVDRASLYTGYSISNPSIMNPLFDGNDIALLGDIHKKQNMQDYDPANNKPCVHYCGSLIQQNHGEDLKGHGYSLWDLSTRSYTFNEIPNPYGYFTVEIDNGKLTTDLRDIPPKVRLRAKIYDTISSDVKLVIASIKEKVQVVETSYIRIDQAQNKTSIIPLCKNIVLNDLANEEYQSKLISEYLDKKLKIVDAKKLDHILQINRYTNTLIKKDEFSRNLKWKLIKFEWDNMFTYGEGNSIDFTTMSGTYGVFGPNKSGKSSMLSAIIFCLFDKFDRGYKGVHVLNIRKPSFRCKVELEISGERYFIERNGSASKTGNVKVDVDFWKIKDGKREDLHGTARRNTNDIIRDYIGTYEDFILTAASFQNAKNQSSFIDMGNTDRKDLLVQFIGLNVFDRLYEAAGKRNTELNAILKIHKDKNYQHEVQQNKNALIHAESMFDEISAEVDSLKKQIADVNDQIIAETANIIKLDINVPTDIGALKSRQATADESLKAKRANMASTKKKLLGLEQDVVKIESDIRKIESSNLSESHKNYKTIAEKITNLKQKIDLKKVEVKGKLEKVARLDKHEYDPNCKYCNNNEFVKDANLAKAELVKDKAETDSMLAILNDYQQEFVKFQWVDEAYEKYTKLLTERNGLKDSCSSLSKSMIISTNELEKLDTSYNNVVAQINLYNNNEAAVEVNKKVQAKISSYKQAISNLDVEFQKKQKMLMEVAGKKELFKLNIEKLTTTINEVFALEYEKDSYEQYMLTVGRDGIPYQVICNTVPEIEREVNSILSQVSDHSVQIETDGKNVVPFIAYDHGRWPIEITSGYERFVTSLAIRIALTNISNLPKPTCLFIDEGFGTLDPDNLASIPVLLSYLKNNFDFILIISHLDELKDAVDKVIELKLENNFTHVNFG